MSNPKGHILVILRRPFLATTNALINCRNGLMKLSFENIIIDLNIFNLEKKRDQFVDVNLIQDEIYETIDLGEEDFDCNLWSDQEIEIAYEISPSSNQRVHPQWQPPIESLIKMNFLNEPIEEIQVQEVNALLDSPHPPYPLEFINPIFDTG